MPSGLWSIWDTVLRYASLLAIPVLVFALLLLVRTLGKAQVMSVTGLGIATASPVLALAVYAVLMPVSVEPWVAITLAIVGLAAGVAWSLTTRMWSAEGVVYGSRSVAYLFVWALALAVSQVFASIAWYRWVGYTMPALYLSTGLAVGMNAALMVRRSSLLKAG